LEFAGQEKRIEGLGVAQAVSLYFQNEITDLFIKHFYTETIIGKCEL